MISWSRLYLLNEIVDFVQSNGIHLFLVDMIDGQHLIARIVIDDAARKAHLNAAAFVDVEPNELVTLYEMADPDFERIRLVGFFDGWFSGDRFLAGRLDGFFNRDRHGLRGLGKRLFDRRAELYTRSDPIIREIAAVEYAKKLF